MSDTTLVEHCTSTERTRLLSDCGCSLLDCNRAMHRSPREGAGSHSCRTYGIDRAREFESRLMDTNSVTEMTRALTKLCAIPRNFSLTKHSQTLSVTVRRSTRSGRRGKPSTAVSCFAINNCKKHSLALQFKLGFHYLFRSSAKLPETDGENKSMQKNAIIKGKRSE